MLFKTEGEGANVLSRAEHLLLWVALTDLNDGEVQMYTGRTITMPRRYVMINA